MAYASLRGTVPGCNVPGCDNPCRSAKCSHCEKHYYQIRRNGHLGHKAIPEPARTLDHTNGYKLLYSPKHPIGTKRQQSRVYEHRAVYYAENGEGPFACFHCSAEVTWHTMHVDHLDDDPTNNAIGNLVASCPTCNQRRGFAKVKRTARHTRSQFLTLDGRTMPLGDWADELGITGSSLKARLQRWPADRALREPRGRFGPQRRAA